MIRIARLPPSRWEAYRALRLEALKTDPSAFVSSSEEEAEFPESVWRERIRNVVFALSHGKPVGMLSYVFSDRVKTKHVVNIYGVYVTPGQRGQGAGKMLLRRALTDIRRNGDIVKVQLTVNADLRPAVALYKQAGFEVVGRSKNGLKVGGSYYDMLLMEKEIRKVTG